MTWVAPGAAFETTTGVGDKPVGTVSGDLLLGCFSTDGFNAIMSVGPPAWDSPNLVVQGITYDNQNLQVVTRTAGGSEPSTYTFTGVGIGCGIIGRVAQYTGGAIVEGTPGVSNSGNTSTISVTAPAITIPGTNHDLWLIVALDQDTDEAWTPNAASSGLTLRAVANIAGQYSCLAIFSLDSAATGSTGSKTVTFSGGSGAAGWAAVLLGVPCTASASGGTGDANITLGALTTVATGTLPIAGSAAITLGALTTAATGIHPIAGTASITLGALLASGAGGVAIVGAAAITLGALTLAATGTVGAANTGTAAITLGTLTAAATGTLPIAGATSITLGALLASGAAGLAVTGTANITLGALTVVGAGNQGGTGDANITLGALTVSATAEVSGTPTQTLGGGGLADYDISRQKRRIAKTVAELREAAPAEVIVQMQPGALVGKLGGQLRALRRTQQVHSTPFENLDTAPAAVADAVIDEREKWAREDDEDLIDLIGYIL